MVEDQAYPKINMLVKAIAEVNRKTHKVDVDLWMTQWTSS